MKRFLKRLTLTALIILGVGFLIPQNLKMPVVGAGTHSYNHETFWYGGWGSSIVHKGVDIFARKGTRMNSATMGIVLATGELGKGGKYVLILGPKWRLHYYAHLNEITTSPFPLSLKTHKSERWAIREMQNPLPHTCITPSQQWCPTPGALMMLR